MRRATRHLSHQADVAATRHVGFGRAHFGKADFVAHRFAQCLRTLEPPERGLLDLANALAREIQFAADFIERAPVAVVLKP